MKIYQTLRITGEKAVLSRLVSEMRVRSKGDWFNMDIDRAALRGVVLTLGCVVPGSEKKVKLVVSERDAAEGLGALVVANIVPVEMGQLTPEEYGRVLRAFVDQIVVPAQETCGTTGIVMDHPEVTPATYLSVRDNDLLLAFEVGANRGVPHPQDDARWRAFLIACHMSRVRLPTDVLQDWLIEQGWTEGRAIDLVIQYEQARSLLAQYDETDGS